MAFISGLLPCLDFMELIFVLSCSFSCSSLVNSFFKSEGFYINYDIPKMMTRFLHILHAQFEIKLVILSFVHSIFSIPDLQQIKQEYPMVLKI